MKRKALPLFLALLVLCTLAAGCTRKNNTDDLNNGQNQQQNGQNNGNNNNGNNGNNGNTGNNNNNQNPAEITVERIFGFLGRTRDELATLFTGNSTVTDDGELYQEKIYGANARVRAEYDKDKKIERFYIYTDETGFTNNFRTELDKLYGAFNEETGWQNKDFTIRVKRENGEVVMILERVDTSSGTGNNSGTGNSSGSGNSSGTGNNSSGSGGGSGQ